MVKITEHLSKNYDKNQFLRINKKCSQNTAIVTRLNLEKCN